MSSKLFSDFALSAEMTKAIARLGFEQPAPIQAEALPPLLEGRDVVGQSQTGSGKTAAFGIPLVERIVPADRFVQGLILCPTRELAIQVCEEIRKLAFFKTGVRPLPVYGGQSYERQFAGLKAGANVVIGTPGRIMDHMNRGTLKLERIRTVILDEADEMLNMGFRDDIEFILKAVPTERQTVLFSATLPRAIEDLISRYTRDSVRVKIQGQALTVPTVEQVYVEIDRRRKVEALERLIDLHDVQRAIVFCNTQRMVDELTEHLNAAGYAADCIHGGMAQGARDRTMKKFRTGGIGFLVATDVAARGIDVDDIQIVFNYDLPYDGEDYVHRIGRTGRAGRKGLAMSFVSGRELFQIRQIERYTRQRMRRVEVPSLGEIEAAKWNQIVQRIRTTLQEADFRHYDHLIEGLLEEGIDSVDLANALFHLVAAGSNMPADAKPVASAAPRTPTPNKIAAEPAVRATATPVASTKSQVQESPAPAEAAEVIAASQPEVSESATASAEAPTAQDTETSTPTPTPAATPASKPAATPAPARRRTASESTAPSRSSREPSRSFSDRRERGTVGDRPQRGYGREREGERERSSYGRDRMPSRPSENRGERFDSRGPGRFERPARTRFQDQGPERRDFDNRRSRPPYQDSGWTPPTPRKREWDAPRDARPSPTTTSRESAGAEYSKKPASRRTPGEMTRLWLSVGKEHGITPGDVKGCILGETGVIADSVGYIDLRERHSFVDVSSGNVSTILPKLNRAHLGGRKLKAKVV